MKKYQWLGGGVAVVVLVTAAGVMASRKSPNETDKPAEKVWQFTATEVVTPQSLALADIITFSGPLVAPSTAIVRAKAAGTLTSLHVAEGSRVRAGDRLGQIDLAELNARLNERQAQAEATRAQLAQAERTQASNQRLSEQQFISANALDASKAALDSARAAHQAALAQVETVKISLRDAGLVAPISGIVAKRHAVPGEKLSAEQQVLTIVDLRTLEMAGSVGTHEVSRLTPGLAVELKVEGVAKPIVGTLARIAPAAEAGTRSIGVTVALANPQEMLRAGQFASAQVRLNRAEPRLTVPVTALASSSGQEYLWTVEQGKLMRRTVVTGRRDPLRGLVEVTEGLPEQALVLATRFENLREGAAAQVGQAPAASAAPASASGSAPASQSAAAKG